MDNLIVKQDERRGGDDVGGAGIIEIFNYGAQRRVTQPCLVCGV